MKPLQNFKWRLSPHVRALWSGLKGLFMFSWREMAGLHLFNYFKTFTQAVDLGPVAGEDILWTDLAFFLLVEKNLN